MKIFYTIVLFWIISATTIMSSVNSHVNYTNNEGYAMHEKLRCTDTGYNVIAHCYEQGRADYPPESIERLLSAVEYSDELVICDLAAGTGKLARAVLAEKPQAHVIAIEPSPKMCDEFMKQVPGAIVKQASAENIPLPDVSVDIVLVGTAFHWFAHERALAEIARILKPGGRIGLIWNVFDINEQWVKKIRALLDAYRDAEEQACNHDSLQWQKVFDQLPLFQPLQHMTYQYGIEGSQQDVIHRICASKVFGALSDAEQEKVLADAYGILAESNLPQVELTIPYRIEIYWTSKK